MAYRITFCAVLITSGNSDSLCIGMHIDNKYINNIYSVVGAIRMEVFRGPKGPMHSQVLVVVASAPKSKGITYFPLSVAGTSHLKGLKVQFSPNCPTEF